MNRSIRHAPFPSRRPRHRPALAATCSAAALSLALAGCGSPEPRAGEGKSAPADPAAAWQVVYEVLQHPRCVNCHPAGNVPLQGEESRPHAQNVQRGTDGTGRFALRCANCHREENTPGAHQPPGAPHWQLPKPSMPLVFEGRTSAELCRQLADPEQNGGRTPEQVYEHIARDPLVLWGWSPGEGREPIPVPHAELLAALRTWIDGGCACPEE
jgi:hypothetical protein